MTNINIDTLKEAFEAINGKKALGVDHVTKSEYGKNLDANLANLVKKISNGSYKPLPKREVLFPKQNGKTRPIAIVSFEDKLVDWCVGAIEAIYYSLENGTKSNVVEIDFSSFFNTIPHKKLIRVLEKRIADKRFIGLIYRLLTGEILKRSRMREVRTYGSVRVFTFDYL